MKSKFPLYFLLYFLIVSCTNNTENSTVQVGKTKKTSPINCYRYSTANDTITLKLIHVGESITGTLVYKLEGKDKIMGTISGGMRGDLLVADYTRMSKEIMPIRQIAFKKKQNFFVEGEGDINTNNDRVSFTNLDSLRFNDTIKLMEMDCQK